MGDRFSATLYAVGVDGTSYYGPAETSTIMNYLLAKIADNNSSSELKTLAVDMLNYGAAAQIFFGYDVVNLVNAGLTEEQKAMGTQGIPLAADTSYMVGDGVAIINNVSLKNKVIMYMTCRYASTDDSHLEFVVKDAKSGEQLARYEPTLIMSAGCQCSYGDVGARQMRQSLIIELYDNDKLVSQSFTWSVESYVASIRADEKSSPELIAVANAMLTYGDSAAAYLEASGQ